MINNLYCDIRLILTIDNFILKNIKIKKKKKSDPHVTDFGSKIEMKKK